MGVAVKDVAEDDKVDLPSARVLRVAECLALHGPVSLEMLAERLGVSKSATWRHVMLLRAAGWVRMRQANRLIELDHRIDELFSTARYSDAEWSRVQDCLTRLAEGYSIHTDLFFVDRGNGLVLHDTSRRVTSLTRRGDLGPDEDLWLMARAAMTPVQLVRHLNEVLAHAAPEFAMQVRLGHYGRAIRAAGGVKRTADGMALLIAVRGENGTAGVIRLAMRGTEPSRRDLPLAVAELGSSLEGAVQFLGSVGSSWV